MKAKPPTKWKIWFRDRDDETYGRVCISAGTRRAATDRVKKWMRRVSGKLYITKVEAVQEAHS